MTEHIDESGTDEREPVEPATPETDEPMTVPDNDDVDPGNEPQPESDDGKQDDDSEPVADDEYERGDDEPADGHE